jgi:phosphoenolpyruvate carboxykinase (ATP)
MVPVAVADVDSAILDPRSTWADKAGYDATAQNLVGQFIENFAQFADHVDEGVRQAAPTAA